MDAQPLRRCLEQTPEPAHNFAAKVEMKKNLIILGARQHAKVLISILREFFSNEYAIVGCLDDDPKLTGTTLLSVPILGPMNLLPECRKRHGVNSALIGVSNRFMKVRDQLFQKVKQCGLETPNLIHPRAYVSSDAHIGRGVVLNPGVIVNAFASVGDNCVCYSNATIEHETQLEENVYVGPGVNFSSNARVGAHTFLGAGSRIIPDIQIGTRVLVGAGTVIIRNVPDDCTVVGVPAKMVKQVGTFSSL